MAYKHGVRIITSQTRTGNSQAREINEDYRTHSKELNDLKYEYLGGQLTKIEPKIKETKDRGTKEQLRSVKEQVSARMEKLRPSKNVKGRIAKDVCIVIVISKGRSVDVCIAVVTYRKISIY